MTLARGDIGHPSYLMSMRFNSIQFTVVGFHREELVTNVDHAVPGPVRLKVIRFGVPHGMGSLERTEVRNNGLGAIAIYLDDSIGDIGYSV